MFDVLIIGGGVSGISCSCVGFCKSKPFAIGKKIESSRIKSFLTSRSCFNNAYGIAAEL
jgi:hypothetical protein